MSGSLEPYMDREPQYTQKRDTASLYPSDCVRWLN
jgi:hypothetical protein